MLKKIVTHPKMFYPLVIFFTGITFGPLILLGGTRPVYATWEWVDAHPEMPLRMAFSGNPFTSNHVTLTSHEGMRFMLPALNPDPTATGLVSHPDYLPNRIPWMTRTVNESVQVVPAPVGSGINTNVERAGIKAGFTPGVTEITVIGRYELTETQLVLIYSNGTRDYFDIERPDDQTMVLDGLTFRLVPSAD